MPPRETPTGGTEQSTILKGWMTRAKKTWGESAKKGKESASFQRLPNATYLMRLNEATLTVSRANMPMLVVQYVVAAGRLVGKSHRNYVMLDGKNFEEGEGEERLARFFAQHGVDPETIPVSKIESTLKTLSGQKPYLKITLRGSRTGDFQNTNIDTFLGADYDVSDYEDTSGDVDEDSETEADGAVDEDDTEAEDESADSEEESEDEEEAEDAEPAPDEEPDIEVGMEIQYPWKGETLTGEVLEINEDSDNEEEHFVLVRAVKDGKKIRRKLTPDIVAQAVLASAPDAEDEDEEEGEAPAPPPARRKK